MEKLMVASQVSPPRYLEKQLIDLKTIVVD